MKSVFTVLALAVLLVMIGALSAADEKVAGEKMSTEKKADESKAPTQAENPLMRLFKGLNLTEEQQAKAEELNKEFAPKFKEAVGKMENILTEEQKKARDEAMRAAIAAGKKGQEIAAAVRSAITLTDEQKAKGAEVRKELGALQQDFLGKVMALLTPEQREQMKNMLERLKAPPKPKID